MTLFQNKFIQETAQKNLLQLAEFSRRCDENILVHFFGSECGI